MASLRIALLILKLVKPLNEVHGFGYVDAVKGCCIQPEFCGKPEVPGPDQLRS